MSAALYRAVSQARRRTLEGDRTFTGACREAAGDFGLPAERIALFAGEAVFSDLVAIIERLQCRLDQGDV
ncbi:hypothetical protein ACKVEX_15190 [Rhodocyclaceae bacterium SMB388]